MHTPGSEPRTRAKIPAGTQDQQASGFLVEVMHVQHVPSFQRGEKPQNQPSGFSVTLLSSVFSQLPQSSA